MIVRSFEIIIKLSKYLVRSVIRRFQQYYMTKTECRCLHRSELSHFPTPLDTAVALMLQTKIDVKATTGPVSSSSKSSELTRHIHARIHSPAEKFPSLRTSLRRYIRYGLQKQSQVRHFLLKFHRYVQGRYRFSFLSMAKKYLEPLFRYVFALALSDNGRNKKFSAENPSHDWKG